MTATTTTKYQDNIQQDRTMVETFDDQVMFDLTGEDGDAYDYEESVYEQDCRDYEVDGDYVGGGDYDFDAPVVIDLTGDDDDDDFDDDFEEGVDYIVEGDGCITIM